MLLLPKTSNYERFGELLSRFSRFFMSSFYFVTVAPCAAMNSSGIFRTVSDGFLYDVKITERTGG